MASSLGGGGLIASNVGIPPSSDDRRIPLSAYIEHYRVRYELDSDGVNFSVVSDLTTKTEKTYRNIIGTPPTVWSEFGTPNNRYAQTIVRRAGGEIDVYEAGEAVGLKPGDSVLLPTISDTETNVLRRELKALRELGGVAQEQW